MIEYQLKLSAKRKTISIKVDCGKVLVLAPQKEQKRNIDQFVQSKQNWILDAVNKQRKYLNHCLHHNFQEGDLCYYLGKKYPIKWAYGKNIRTGLRDDNCIWIRITNNTSPKHLEKTINSWYRQQAEKIIVARTEKFAEDFSTNFSKISFRRYKNRWGSCNSKRELAFNWRLILAPMYVIDYVIIHELCHLDFLNHSSEFWALVRKRYPSYKHATDWLIEYQYAALT